MDKVTVNMAILRIIFVVSAYDGLKIWKEASEKLILKKIIPSLDIPKME